MFCLKFKFFFFLKHPEVCLFWNSLKFKLNCSKTNQFLFFFTKWGWLHRPYAIMLCCMLSLNIDHLSQIYFDCFPYSSFLWSHPTSNYLTDPTFPPSAQLYYGVSNGSSPHISESPKTSTIFYVIAATPTYPLKHTHSIWVK